MRFASFYAPGGSDPEAKGGKFKVVGIYRPPRVGEWFWYTVPGYGVGLARCDFSTPRVILEKVG